MCVSSLLTVTNKEICPFEDCDIVTMTFNSDGGVLIIEEHGLKLTIPRGAIEDGIVVEIQAAVSLFGPFIIRNEYHLISGFVWIGACYMFNKPLTLEIEHYADVSNEDDIGSLCVLKACMKHKQELYEMHEVPERHYQYCLGSSFCSFSTKHFCSMCLAKKNLNIPDRIVVYQYLPDNYKYADEYFRAEVCICYDFSVCKKVIIKNIAMHVCAW